MRAAEFWNCCSVHVLGTEPEALLRELSQRGISFWNYRQQGITEASFLISGKFAKDVKAAGRGFMVEISPSVGILPGILRMKWRMLFIVWLLVLTGIVAYLQGAVWFFTVSGCEELQEEQVLRGLEDCGIRQGIREFDLYSVKNSLQMLLPAVSWITVNREGPVAHVLIQERRKDVTPDTITKPGVLVAKLPGLVESIQVTDGAAAVLPGDTVEEGQILISGVSEEAEVTLLAGADGEVVARTWHETTVILPKNRMEKCYTGRERRLISLNFGKKKINFYKKSGISYDEYDKMKVRKPLTLPGGYQLPVSLEILTLREYTLQKAEELYPEKLMEQCACEAVTQKLSSGEILQTDGSLLPLPMGYSYLVKTECREEIGQWVEIIIEGS